MYTIDNKFEIGEECYTVCREKTTYKCPFCEGKGKKEYNGYEIICSNCNGSGKLNNPKETVLDVCKVKVKRIIASIWNDNITISEVLEIVVKQVYSRHKKKQKNIVWKLTQNNLHQCFNT